MLWKCQKTHLSHQQEYYYQNWFVFHEQWLVVELYTNRLKENQIAKKCKNLSTNKVVKQRIIDCSFKYFAKNRE